MIWCMCLMALGLFGLWAWKCYSGKVLQKRLEQMEQRLAALEAGLIPDHEKAKAAATAVNDFNAGIVGILGFDPFEARKTGPQ